MVTETELRDRLHSAAYRVGPGGDDLEAADTVIARRRTERRHRAAVLAAAVVVLVVAVLVPVLGQRWVAGRAPAAPRTATTTAVPSQPSDRWLERTRGSLAGDAAFLEAARNLDWTGPDAPPPVADRTIVFAGDAGGTRWVLVAGQVGGRRTGQWFTGPAGAPADALTFGGPEDVQGGLPIGHEQLDATGMTLLVLAEPGDEVQVSPAVVVDSGGQVHRDYSPVPADDGVAVVHEAGPFAGSAVRFRVLRGGAQAGAGPSGSAVQLTDDLGDAARQIPRRPGSGWAPRGAVMNAMQQVLAATGLAPAEAHPVLLWTGPIPLEGAGTTQAVVLALTLPSGAVVTTTAFGSTDIALPSGLCGSAVHPAGTPLDSLVVVARCDTTMYTGGEATFVVSAPSADNGITLRVADGSAISEHALVDGGGVVSDPGSVASASISGHSAPAVQVTPTDLTHDPFAVD